MAISINFSKINYNNTMQQKNSVNFRAAIVSNMPNDSFEKTNSTSTTKSISNNFESIKINKNYDEVYNTVVEQNPMFKELNIPKPDLKYQSDIDIASAYYDFASNSVFLNENINEDWYILIAKDIQGNEIPYEIAPKSEIEQQIPIIKNELNCDDISYTKLSKKEQDLWIKAIFAHELRHCLQDHMVASLNGGIEKLAKPYKKLIDAKKELIQYYIKNGQITDLKEYNKNLKSLQDSKEKYFYVLNFKPYKILDNSTKLKFSMDSTDKREWSVIEHFEKSITEYDNRDENNYISTPVEIDAYNYEIEFIKSQYKGHKNEYSDNFLLALMMTASRVYENVQKLTELGYNAI